MEKRKIMEKKMKAVINEDRKKIDGLGELKPDEFQKETAAILKGLYDGLVLFTVEIGKINGELSDLRKEVACLEFAAFAKCIEEKAKRGEKISEDEKREIASGIYFLDYDTIKRQLEKAAQGISKLRTGCANV